MAVEVATLIATLEADIRQFEQGMRKAEQRLDGLEDGSKRANKATGMLSSGMGKMAAAAAGAFAVGGAVSFGKASVDAFADAGESINAVNVVFEDSADIINDWADTAIDKVGLAGTNVRKAAVPLGAALQNAGLSGEEAAAQVIALTERAADMASVFNTDVNDALGAIQAGLRGEADPLERFGVGLSAAAVKAKALQMGLQDADGQISKTAETTARIALLMDQTSKVQGDFANTSDSLANRQKVMKERMQEFREELGGALAPVMMSLMDLWDELSPAVLQAATAVGKLVAAIAPLASIVGKVLNPVLKAATGYLDLVGKGATSIAALLGDDAAKATLRQTEAMEHLNERMAEGEDPAVALANAAAHVAKNSELTAEEFDKLAKEAGITEDRIDDVKDAMLDAARKGANGLKGQAGELEKAFGRLGDEEEKEIDRLKDIVRYGEDAVQVYEDMHDPVDDMRDVLQKAGRAQALFNDALWELTLLRAPLEEDFDMVAALLREVGVAAGDSVDEVLRLKAALEAAAAIARGDLFGDGPTPTTPGVLPPGVEFRAHGGSVSSGSPYVVGEQGPELFVPNRSGTILPNGSQLSGGGGTVVFNVQVHEIKSGSEFVREMERELRMRNLQVTG